MADEGDRERTVLPKDDPSPDSDRHTHRVEVTPAGPGVRVRVTRDGVELADSTAALLLTETGYPDRYYLPRADVRTDQLVATSTRTHCPFKGDAGYWAPRAAPTTDVAWEYAEPEPRVEAVRDHLCFHETEGVRVETLSV